MKKWPFTTAAVLGGLWLYTIAPGKISDEGRKKFAVKFFAHRGLHTSDGEIPENSLTAFEKASQNGYGSELDVNLDADGNVVVFHDHDLKRLTGVEGHINELTASRREKLRLLGSNEKIPTLKEVLEISGDMPLIVELKETPRYRELCRKTLALISKYPGDVVIESFEPRIVAWFRANAPHVVRGFLTTKYTRSNMKNPFVRILLNSLLTNVVTRPHYIAADKKRIKSPLVNICRILGAATVVWTTVTEQETITALYNDAVIFENHSPHSM